ncbi:unnamed protein product [Cylicocyclus nassatus]|uniref:Uncharacterized protein n=1 Tax=Cylicocyclus nassatus TaxID=53992 RepID=A0AA36DTZ8_CYLNA|nr:unnamed protein product [Cylicocyclus nassatus]
MVCIPRGGGATRPAAGSLRCKAKAAPSASDKLAPERTLLRPYTGMVAIEGREVFGPDTHVLDLVQVDDGTDKIKG